MTVNFNSQFRYLFKFVFDKAFISLTMSLETMKLIVPRFLSKYTDLTVWATPHSLLSH